MTFWIGVASRPPHSLGQLMAAHRPSFSRRCQSRRRSWVRAMPADCGPPGSSSPPQSARNFGRFSSSQDLSSSRNARSSASYAKSTNLTVASGFVDFTFSPDQDALRAAVNAFLQNEAGMAYVRAMADDERGVTDDMWARIAQMGWPGLLVPESL